MNGVLNDLEGRAEFMEHELEAKRGEFETAIDKY
jgi:hypothetical protein